MKLYVIHASSRKYGYHCRSLFSDRVPFLAAWCLFFFQRHWTRNFLNRFRMESYLESEFSIFDILLFILYNLLLLLQINKWGMLLKIFFF